MLRSCLLILALTVTAAAQDIQVTGGGSTLFDASGAQVKAIFATSATSLSGGVSDGHVYAGLLETTKFHGLNVSAGDLNLPFVLATDFTSTPSFPAVGLTVSQKDSTREWTAFLGATADSYSTPFFFGSKTSAATAAFFGTERLTETLSFNSAEVFSNRQTAIETLVWHPFTPLTFAIAGGIGSNNPFGAARAGWKTQHWVGVLNYTRHGASFQRITLPYGTITENSGLNASGAFNSTHFHASVDHTSYDNFVNSTLIESTVNSASASTSLSVFSANASSFFGTSAGLPVSGQTQGRRFRCRLYHRARRQIPVGGEPFDIREPNRKILATILGQSIHPGAHGERWR
jgi:hypothetical protein